MCIGYRPKDAMLHREKIKLHTKSLKLIYLLTCDRFTPDQVIFKFVRPMVKIFIDLIFFFNLNIVDTITCAFRHSFKQLLKHSFIPEIPV